VSEKMKLESLAGLPRLSSRQTHRQRALWSAYTYGSAKLIKIKIYRNFYGT